jgi:uncharacterized membrane protein HdeD (DUF308 family)
MKSFFTFFDRSYGYSRAIISAIIGLVLVIWPDTAVKSIVIVIGAALLLMGAVTMIFSKRPEEDRNRSILSINGAVSLIFGLVLVVFPTFFVGIIMFLFGAILLIIGIGEVASVLSARNETNAPLSLITGPIITTLCGVVIFFNPFSTMEWLFVFFGISLLVYSLTEFISTKKLRKIYKDMADTKASTGNLIQDIEYEEVEEEK